MTGPVKPPGGATPPAGVEAPEASPPSGFAERVAGAAPSEPTQATGAAASPVVQELLAALASGAVDGAGAVDAIVQRALESPTAAGLGLEARQRLEALLREMLASDPHLSSLVRALDRP